MTMTPHRGVRVEDALDEVVDPAVAEVEDQAASVPDPIFWEVVSQYGYPPLSHKIDVVLTVYNPKAEKTEKVAPVVEKKAVTTAVKETKQTKGKK